MSEIAGNCYPIRKGEPLTNFIFEDLDVANQAFIVLLGLKSSVLLDANNKLVRMAIQQVIINQMVGSQLDRWLTAIRSHINALYDLLHANYPVEDDPVLISLLAMVKISHDEMLTLWKEHVDVD